MKICAVICEASSVRVWGLTPAERIRRFLERKGIGVVAAEAVPGSAESVLVIRGDHVFDDRVLAELLARSPLALRRTDAPRDPVVAAHVPVVFLEGTLRSISAGSADPDPQIVVQAPGSLVSTGRPVLRKVQAAFAIAVTADNRRAVEQFLYDCSYKTITDLVTKWVWPVPARWVVRGCVRLGLRPNHVTALGFGLMVTALWLFARGAFVAGLFAGWAMSFLDTVDGKLARTTLTSSRLGHYLDKVTDLVHPPFWYLAWAKGLSTYDSPTPGISLETLVVAIFAFYVVGRLAEGVCSRALVAGGIFVWRPLDSYFRLVTARRNTCLLLLTAGMMLERPDLGLWLVGAWTAATSLFLVARTVAAWSALRRASAPRLRSWLLDLDVEAETTGAPFVVRVFARRSVVRP